MKVSVWKIEAMFVFFVLALVAYFSGNQLEEWIVCFAILFTFMHAQVADRMQEKEGEKDIPDVACHQKLKRYFFSKEILWVFFFIVTKTYTAILGSVIFLLYPFWRKRWRKKDTQHS